jgi:hypothetical protein
VFDLRDEINSVRDLPPSLDSVFRCQLGPAAAWTIGTVERLKHSLNQLVCEHVAVPAWRVVSYAACRNR